MSWSRGMLAAALLMSSVRPGHAAGTTKSAPAHATDGATKAKAKPSAADAASSKPDAATDEDDNDNDDGPKPQALAAEALFQDGRALLQAGKAEQACEKLSESQRLDPATGTLMALAMCHEQTGQLASAWAEFTEVAKSSRRTGRADRAEFAAQHVGALRPRLSSLTVDVSDGASDIDGLQVRRDDVPIADDLWGVPVPVDGGSHVIEAHAPGYVAYRTSVHAEKEGDTVKLTIPALEARQSLEPAATPAPATGDVEILSGAVEPRAGHRPWRALEWSGAIGIGAGVVALGVGAYFLGTAFSKMSDSHADCVNDACGPAGLADRQDAVHNGDLATAFGGAGAALSLLGASLFVIGRSQHAERPSAQSQSRPRLRLEGSSRGIGASLTTAF